MRAYPRNKSPFLVCLPTRIVSKSGSWLNSISHLATKRDPATLLFVLRTQWILVSLLVLFALVVLSLVWTVGHHLDTQIFLLFNLRGYHAKWLDHLMWLATQLGNIVTAFTVAFVFFWLNYRDLAVGITPRHDHALDIGGDRQGAG